MRSIVFVKQIFNKKSRVYSLSGSSYNLTVLFFPKHQIIKTNKIDKFFFLEF